MPEPTAPPAPRDRTAHAPNCHPPHRSSAGHHSDGNDISAAPLDPDFAGAGVLRGPAPTPVETARCGERLRRPSDPISRMA
jgi:hypothetical protein